MLVSQQPGSSPGRVAWGQPRDDGQALCQSGMGVLEKAVQPHGIVLRPTLQERAFGVVRKTKQLIGCDAQGLANFVDQGEVRLGLCALVARIAIFVYAEGLRKATRARISRRCSRRRFANAARTGGASVLRCLGRGTCYLPRRASPMPIIAVSRRRGSQRPGAANG